jgi:hypothetical protein
MKIPTQPQIYAYPGSVTRYNTILDESASESSFQGCLQWATYQTIQLVIATLTGVKEDSSFKFNTLLFSGLLSTLSLTMGQLKVSTMSMTIMTYMSILHTQGAKISAEYLMTVPQQAVYFLAALGKKGLVANIVTSQLGGDL